LAISFFHHKISCYKRSDGEIRCCSAVITEAEEGGFIALNPETGTTTQGETYQEAIHNLKEATSLYLDEFPMKIHSHPVMTTFEISHA